MNIGNPTQIITLIKEYFSHLDNFIRENNTADYDKIVKIFEKFDKIIPKLKKFDNSVKSIMSYSHITEYTHYLLSELYTLIDFPLSSDELLSTSRAQTMGIMFVKISDMYKQYVSNQRKKWNDEIQTMIDALIKHNPPARDVQKLFHEYIYSIRVYSGFMKSRLKYDSDIENMIEFDKSIVLQESKWISPFLSFNLTAGPLLTESSKTSNCQILIVRGSTHIHILPKTAIDPEAGITESSTNSTLEEIQKKPTSDPWQVIINDKKCETINILEKVGGRYRQLLHSGKSAIPRSHISKMLNRQYSRPRAFGKRMDEKLKKITTINARYLGQLNFPRKIITLPVAKIHTNVVKKFKEYLSKSKSDKYDPTDDMDDVAKHFTYLILETIDTIQKSTLSYLINWLNEYFKKQMLDGHTEYLKMTPDAKQTHGNINAWFHKFSYKTIKSLLGADNVFQVLYEKEHIANNLKKRIG
jgi:hypothetical protein